MNEDKEEEIFNELLANGGLKFAGINPENGEKMYSRTPLLKDLAPELNEDLNAYCSQVTMGLWEKGFINMNITQENPIVTLSPRAFEKDRAKILTEDERQALREIIKTLSNKK